MSVKVCVTQKKAGLCNADLLYGEIQCLFCVCCSLWSLGKQSALRVYFVG